MSAYRILHIIGKMDRAGAETMLMNLYRHIDREIVQFDFVTFTYDKGDYDDEIISLGGQIIPLVTANPLTRMQMLKQFLQQHPEYQTVHAHALLSNAFHLLAAKHAGVNQRISHSHNTSNGQQSLIKKVYEKWALSMNRKLATHKLACGEEAANYLFRSTKDVLLINNSVDVDSMIDTSIHAHNYIKSKIDTSSKVDIDSKVDNKLKKETKSSENDLKLIQVGRFNEVKNHKFSLEVAKELKNLKVNFRIYFAGQGPLEDELKHEVKKSGLQQQVKFLGVRSDITELMSSADLMLMPSLHEGFPVVLVESQAVGLKAIISNHISKEVDLDLGLVDFLAIDSPQLWARHIVEQNKAHRSPSISKIKNVLKQKGFDAKTNAKKLTHLYLGSK